MIKHFFDDEPFENKLFREKRHSNKLYRSKIEKSLLSTKDCKLETVAACTTRLPVMQTTTPSFPWLRTSTYSTNLIDTKTNMPASHHRMLTSSTTSFLSTSKPIPIFSTLKTTASTTESFESTTILATTKDYNKSNAIAELLIDNLVELSSAIFINRRTLVYGLNVTAIENKV